MQRNDARDEWKFDAVNLQGAMKAKVVYQSEERIFGFSARSREYIEYSATITIKDSGKKPVSIKLSFVPPHPYVFDMPLTRKVEAESLSQAFAKIAKFFRGFGFEMR